MSPVDEKAVRLGAIALWESDFDLQNWPRNVLFEIARLVLEAASSLTSTVRESAPGPEESTEDLVAEMTAKLEKAAQR